MSTLQSDWMGRALHAVAATALALAATVVCAGCSTSTTSPPPTVSTSSDDVARCERNGNVWRNGTCLSMSGGAY